LKEIKNEIIKFKKIGNEKKNLTEKEAKEYKELEEKIDKCEELKKRILELEKELDFSDSEDERENENKEVANHSKKLNELIEINEKSVINFEGESSQKNLLDFLMPKKDKAGGKKNNALYHMSEEEKDKEAENYKGLDRKLFDKIRERVGKYQASTSKLVAHQLSHTILATVPFVGNIAQIPMTIENYNQMDNFVIEIEKRLTVDEVKEIVREITKEATETQTITKKNLIIIKEMLESQEEENKTEIERLESEKRELAKKLQKAASEAKTA